MSYRVGLVGTGGIARAHAQACRQVEEAELAAVCDISAEALERFGEEWGVEARFGDLEQMLGAAELDIAILCNWGAQHASAGIQIARSGRVRAILCEKPLTMDAAEAERLVAAARAGGVLLAEAFKFRHHPMHLRVGELVREGAIGELLQVRSTFCTCVPAQQRRPENNWRWNRARGGGSIYDLACYNIHHARFAFGCEPERVFAAEQPGVEVDDAAAISLVFSGGRSAQISVGFNAWGSQYAELVGTEGMLRLDRAWNNENQPVAIERHSREGVERLEFAPVFQFALQLEHLCQCLETGRAHRIPPEDSVAQMRVLDAVYASMRTGRAVEPGAGKV